MFAEDNNSSNKIRATTRDTSRGIDMVDTRHSDNNNRTSYVSHLYRKAKS